MPDEGVTELTLKGAYCVNASEPMAVAPVSATTTTVLLFLFLSTSAVNPGFPATTTSWLLVTDVMEATAMPPMDTKTILEPPPAAGGKRPLSVTLVLSVINVGESDVTVMAVDGVGGEGGGGRGGGREEELEVGN